MKSLNKWIKDCLTEPDGETICPIRIFAIIGFGYLLFTHAWSIYVLRAVFDLQAAAIGYSSLMITTGVALGSKTDATKKEP